MCSQSPLNQVRDLCGCEKVTKTQLVPLHTKHSQLKVKPSCLYSISYLTEFQWPQECDPLTPTLTPTPLNVLLLVNTPSWGLKVSEHKTEAIPVRTFKCKIIHLHLAMHRAI